MKRGVAPKLGAGLLLAGVALGTFLAGEFPLFCFVTALYVLAYVELRRIFLLAHGGSGGRATLFFGAVAVGAVAWLAYDGRVDALPWVVAALLLTVLVVRILLVEAGAGTAEGATVDAGATVTAAGVVGLLGSHLFLVRSFPRFGFRGALALGLMVLCNGGFAFIAGRIFGRRPLAPRISPGKTWEGLAGGTIATMAVGLGAGLWLDPPFTLGAALVIGAMICVLAPVGDLAASALKRNAGLKDSAAYIPGQGGALDVLDALLFCSAPFYWAFRTLVL